VPSRTDASQLPPPPPIWPPTTELLKLPANPAYDVRMVPATSISLVTTRQHKVGRSWQPLLSLKAHADSPPSQLDAEAIRAIADKARKSAINETLNALVDIAAEFQEAGSFPEVDWSKSRKLEFQDALKARTGLVKQQRKRKIDFAADFKAHVRCSFDRPLPTNLAPDPLISSCSTLPFTRRRNCSGA
jgi:hypothetical protein